VLILLALLKFADCLLVATKGKLLTTAEEYPNKNNNKLHLIFNSNNGP